MTTEDTGSPLPTELIHLTYEGNFQLECSAKVVGCQVVDDESAEIQLDRTTMHPQGGGQPTDIGVLVANDNKQLIVPKVTLDRETGIVTHSATGGTLQVGDTVKVSVDEHRRLLYSECHTAGHVVDSAMARCGKTLPPTKGYHFLDGPYVEYKGSIPVEEREDLLKQLKQAFAELVEEDIATEIETLSHEEAEARCNRVQQNFDLSEFGKGDDPIRIVTVAGWPCPCGGTHVKSTADLKEREWGITGMKSKKGVVRVKYGSPHL